MMDKKPHIKPYLYGMLAGFGAISLSILFFFFIYRFDGFGDAVSKVTGILMPFIYGAVIAYLLKPVCNTIEGFLHRIFPPKAPQHGQYACHCGDAAVRCAGGLRPRDDGGAAAHHKRHLPLLHRADQHHPVHAVGEHTGSLLG